MHLTLLDPFTARSKVRIALGVILLACLASHAAGISAIEFTGEDEVMFMQTGLTVLYGLLGHFGRVAELFVFYYPPLQSMVPTPFMAVWGASEWTLRLPGVLAGVLTCGLLYLVVRQCGSDRRVALLASLLYGVSGIAGNNKFALTCGILAPGLIVAAHGLARFLTAEDERVEGRALMECAAGLVWSTLSLQDGLFYIPIVALAYWRKKGWQVSSGAGRAMGVLVAGVAVYALLWIVTPRLLAPDSAGGFLKVKTILSQLGAFRVTDLFYSFYTATSWVAIMLAAVLLPLGLKAGTSSLRWMALFYGFPLALWVFAFDYPNVRSAHMLNAFPGFCALWATGAIAAWDALRRRSGIPARLVLAALSLLVVWAIASIALQNAVLYGTDRIPGNLASVLGPVSTSHFAQGRRYERFGQHAAGLYVRERTRPDQGVLCNLGGSFAAYYAHRPGSGLRQLAVYGVDSNRWKVANIRYLVAAPSLSLPAGSPDRRELTLAAQVLIDGRISLAIYDLWGEATEPCVIDGDAVRAQFVAQGTPWREMIR